MGKDLQNSHLVSSSGMSTQQMSFDWDRGGKAPDVEPLSLQHLALRWALGFGHLAS